MRDSLLHILGAGITRTAFTELPNPLPLTFALRIVLEPRELRPQHVLELRLVNQRGEREAALEITLPVPESEREAATEEAAIALPVPLNVLEIARTGRYLLEADFDGRTIGTFPLRIERVVPEGRGGDPEPPSAEQPAD